jgi:hypothetical protein
MLRRRRHSAEEGQTLVLSLAFLALFGLFAVTVLRFADVTEAQRTSTERTAAIDGVAEGSAQFAVADTALLGCGTVTAGTMHFASGDSLAYKVPGGGCSASIAGVPVGRACELCLLNSANPDVDHTVLSTNKPLAVNGEIASNGVMSGTVGAFGPYARIGLVTGAWCTSNGLSTGTQSCTPKPTPIATPFADPLAGTLQTPSAAGPSRSWTSGDATTLDPGVYSAIKATTGTVTLNAGVYVVTGPITVDSIGVLASNGGVVIYLACATTAPSWSCGAAGQSGGSISVTGDGTLALSESSDPRYPGISLFADPNLVDPNGGDTSALNVTGAGATIAGTIYLPAASVNISGDVPAKGLTDTNGRMVVRALTISGDTTAVLNLGGTVTPACSLYTDEVTGTLADQRQLVAHVRFEANCGGTSDSIINFAYGVGP